MERVKFDIFEHCEERENYCEVHGSYMERGIPVNGRIIWCTCPDCINEENDRIRRGWARDAVRRRDEAMAQARSIDAALPVRLKDRTFSNYIARTAEQKYAKDVCSRYADNWQAMKEKGHCLIMMGRTGTGKTHLAVGIAQHVLGMGDTVIYTLASKISQDVREAFSDKKKTERQVYEGFAKPDLLIIDEIGRQAGTTSEMNILFEVINARYELRKPTIVISNLDPKAFRQYIGDAALSRLQEDGETLGFNGEDMRQAQMA